YRSHHTPPHPDGLVDGRSIPIGARSRRAPRAGGIPRARGGPRSLIAAEGHNMKGNAIGGERLGLIGEGGLWAGCSLAVLGSVAVGAGRGHRATTAVPRSFFEGKELFEKSWEPGKPSPTGGDGLGPLYNETSCVGCHNLGGTGGGGENERNVLMVTAVT